MKKIMEDLLKTIDKVYEIHKNETNTNVSEENKHYFLQGLKVAKQLIEQEQDTIYDEIPYETLGCFVSTLISEGKVEPEWALEIVNDAIELYENQ